MGPGEGVTINAGDVTVVAGSQISADGQGYIGAQSKCSNGAGPGGGRGTNNSYGSSGAGYSGVGGRSRNDSAGVSFGDLIAPVELGSGGGSGDYSTS